MTGRGGEHGMHEVRMPVLDQGYDSGALGLTENIVNGVRSVFQIALVLTAICITLCGIPSCLHCGIFITGLDVSDTCKWTVFDYNSHIKGHRTLPLPGIGIQNLWRKPYMVLSTRLEKAPGPI